MARDNPNSPSETSRSAQRTSTPAAKQRIQLVKCITYPNRRRKRTWTTKNAAQACCRALNSPQEPPVSVFDQVREINQRMLECTDFERGARDAVRAVAQELETPQVTGSLTFHQMKPQVMQVVEENQNLIIATIAILGVILIFGRAIAVLPAFALRLLPAGAVTIVPIVTARIAQLQVQRAANSEFMRRIVGL